MEKKETKEEEPKYDGALVGKRFLITGGGGYFGHRLGKQLVACGAAAVILFDIRPPTSWHNRTEGKDEDEEKEPLKFVMGDLRDFKAVRAAAEGMDAVFHAASFGMSGKDQLDKARIVAINVGGTEHVIKACQEGNVSALVYTSTTNVVFAGNELHNQDESLPYLPLDRHVDYYSRSKCIAEQLVLQANDSASSSPASSLKTCAIRPAGIYGEGEERHLPRIVEMMDKGLFCFTIGRADSKVEFVYVDNLVHAHILAAVKLLKRNKRKEEKEGEEKDIGGRAYFISDWEPINNFEFFRPLLEGLGFRYPSLNLPTWLMYYVALFIETVHW
ncbi:short-chain dehydrogenase/reductase family 42E member 1 [Balamuthia mandrillaris]